MALPTFRTPAALPKCQVTLTVQFAILSLVQTQDLIPGSSKPRISEQKQALPPWNARCPHEGSATVRAPTPPDEHESKPYQSNLCLAGNHHRHSGRSLLCGPPDPRSDRHPFPAPGAGHHSDWLAAQRSHSPRQSSHFGIRHLPIPLDFAVWWRGSRTAGDGGGYLLLNAH